MPSDPRVETRREQLHAGQPEGLGQPAPAPQPAQDLRGGFQNVEFVIGDSRRTLPGILTRLRDSGQLDAETGGLLGGRALTVVTGVSGVVRPMMPSFTPPTLTIALFVFNG